MGVDVRGVGAGVQLRADGEALQPAARRDLRAQEAGLQDRLRTGQSVEGRHSRIFLA